MEEADDQSGQPETEYKEREENKTKQWNTMLFSCQPYYCNYFWFTMCCPFCAFSQECAYVEAIARQDQWKTVEKLNKSTCSRNCHGGAWCAMCFCCLVAPLFCFLPCKAREDYRTRKGLPGGPCGSIVTSWCCVCCDMAQVMNEIHEEIKIHQNLRPSRMENRIFKPLDAQSLMPLDTQPLLTNRL